jgi:phosphoribosylformylglycinamidine synthase
MKFIAAINIMPHANLLDPQGKAVTQGLEGLGFDTVSNVRVGKHITLEIEADNEAAAHEKVETSCKKLLVNQVMESYEIKLQTIS